MIKKYVWLYSLIRRASLFIHGTLLALISPFEVEEVILAEKKVAPKENLSYLKVKNALLFFIWLIGHWQY